MLWLTNKHIWRRKQKILLIRSKGKVWLNKNISHFLSYSSRISWYAGIDGETVTKMSPFLHLCPPITNTRSSTVQYEDSTKMLLYKDWSATNFCFKAGKCHKVLLHHHWLVDKDLQNKIEHYIVDSGIFLDNASTLCPTTDFYKSQVKLKGEKFKI